MRRPVSFLLLLVAFSGLAAAQPDAALVQKLRQGGYVLYLRHASTDFSQNDARMTSYEDCTNQRNLTDKGRAEARALGEQLRRLAIPIGPVYASPFCRTMETARLAFGRAERMSEARGGPAALRERLHLHFPAPLAHAHVDPVAGLHFVRRLGARAIQLHAAGDHRLLREAARLEEARGPEPFVQPHQALVTTPTGHET